MPLRTLLLLVLPLLAIACAPYATRQTTITQLREQDALVPAPEVPMGLGASMPAGGVSLSLGGGYTSLQPYAGDDVGQRTLPLSGLARGAVATEEGLEFTASGSMSPLDVAVGPLVSEVDGLRGVLGRGALGMRMFVPLDGPFHWLWTVDFGAEATHLTRTDTVTTTVRDRRWGTETSQTSETSHHLRVLPHARLGTLVRVPFNAGISLVGGAQVQSWPVYWRSRSQVDVQTTFRSGSSSSYTSGDIDAGPSPLYSVLTPTLGLSLHSGGNALHVQGYAHFSEQTPQSVPWGFALTIERIVAPSREDR